MKSLNSLVEKHSTWAKVVTTLFLIAFWIGAYLCSETISRICAAGGDFFDRSFTWDDASLVASIVATSIALSSVTFYETRGAKYYRWLFGLSVLVNFSIVTIGLSDFFGWTTLKGLHDSLDISFAEGFASFIVGLFSSLFMSERKSASSKETDQMRFERNSKIWMVVLWCGFICMLILFQINIGSESSWNYLLAAGVLLPHLIMMSLVSRGFSINLFGISAGIAGIACILDGYRVISIPLMINIEELSIIDGVTKGLTINEVIGVIAVIMTIWQVARKRNDDGNVKEQNNEPAGCNSSSLAFSLIKNSTNEY